jgi:hypothetical protein
MKVDSAPPNQPLHLAETSQSRSTGSLVLLSPLKGYLT